MFIDFVSKTEIKKQYRDVIFLEDDNGNLVKYVRCKLYDEKQKRKGKSSAESIKKVTAKQAPSTEPTNKTEITRTETQECHVALLQLSAGDIAKIKFDMCINGLKQKLNPTDDKVDCSLKLQSDGNLAIRLPDSDTFMVLEPMCASPQRIFSFDKCLSVELQKNGNLVIQLPEIEGKRNSLIVVESIWRSCFDSKMVICNENIHAQSLVEYLIQNLDAETNMSVGSIPSLLDFESSLITQLLDDLDMSMIANLFAKDWLSGSESGMNMEIADGKADDFMCTDQSTLLSESMNFNEDDDGYDASIEVV